MALHDAGTACVPARPFACPAHRGSDRACHATRSSVRNSDTKFRFRRRARYSSARWTVTTPLGVNRHGTRHGSSLAVGAGSHDTARSQRFGYRSATRSSVEHGSRSDAARSGDGCRSVCHSDAASLSGLWTTRSRCVASVGVCSGFTPRASALGGRAHPRRTERNEPTSRDSVRTNDPALVTQARLGSSSARSLARIELATG